MDGGDWRFDGAESLRRVKRALLERKGIDVKRHGDVKRACAALGVNNSVWSNWKKRGAPADRLPEFAARLDVDVLYLFGKEDNMGAYRNDDSSNGALSAIMARMDARFDRLETRIAEIDRRVSDLEETG